MSTMSRSKEGETLLHKNVAVSLYPEEMANVFWQWDDAQQARFYNQLGKIAHKDMWKFEFQMHAISKVKELNELGRSYLRIVAEWFRNLP